MDMAPIHKVRPKQSCKAQLKGGKDQADRRRGGKTTSGMDRCGIRQVPEGSGKQKNGGNWLHSHLWCPNDHRGQRIGEMRWILIHPTPHESIKCQQDILDHMSLMHFLHQLGARYISHSTKQAPVTQHRLQNVLFRDCMPCEHMSWESITSPSSLFRVCNVAYVSLNEWGRQKLDVVTPLSCSDSSSTFITLNQEQNYRIILYFIF